MIFLLFHMTKLLDHDSVLITRFLVFNIYICFVQNMLYVGILIIYLFPHDISYACYIIPCNRKQTADVL